MTAIEAIKTAFCRQKIKGVLLHKSLEDFYNVRSITATRPNRYERLPNGQVVRRRAK
jgi:hypothetical protein